MQYFSEIALCVDEENATHRQYCFGEKRWLWQDPFVQQRAFLFSTSDELVRSNDNNQERYFSTQPKSTSKNLLQQCSTLSTSYSDKATVSLWLKFSLEWQGLLFLHVSKRRKSSSIPSLDCRECDEPFCFGLAQHMRQTFLAKTFELLVIDYTTAQTWNPEDFTSFRDMKKISSDRLEWTNTDGKLDWLRCGNQLWICHFFIVIVCFYQLIGGWKKQPYKSLKLRPPEACRMINEVFFLMRFRWIVVFNLVVYAKEI